MSVKNNVLIIDDHHITRNGLQLMLAQHDRFNIVGALDIVTINGKVALVIALSHLVAANEESGAWVTYDTLPPISADAT